MNILNKESYVGKFLEKHLQTDMAYLTKGSFWLNLNFLISSLLAFLLYIVMAKILPKETYGLYQYVLSLATIFSAFSLTGMGSAITQSVARGNEGDFTRSLLPQLKWSLISSCLALITGIYYLYQGNKFLFVSLIIMAVSLPFINSTNTYIAFFTGKREFKKIFTYSSIFNIIYTIVIIITIFITKNPINIVLSYFLISAGINTTLYIRTLKKNKPNQLFDKDTTSYAKHLSFMNIIGILVGKIDSIIVFQYLGAVNLAIYTFAKIIPEKIGGLLKSFGIIAFPKFAEKNIIDIRNGIIKKTYVFIGFALIFSVLYIFTAPTIFKVFFPNYIESVGYSQLFSLTLITSAASLPVYALISQKLKKKLYILNTLSPLIQLLIMLIMVYFWGIWGLIISKIISGLIQIFVATYLVKY